MKINFYKIASLMLCSMMSVTFAACDGGNVPTSDTDKAETSPVIDIPFMVPTDTEPADGDPLGTDSNDASTFPEPVIISTVSSDAFAQNAAIHINAAKNYGTQTFVTLDDGTKCMKLECDPYDSIYENYRIMFKFKKADMLPADYKFMRVTYMTTETSFASLTVLNNQTKESLALDEDTSDSVGVWMRSDVVDISQNTTHKRFSEGLPNTIQFSSVYDNSEIYISEIAFFVSADHAYSYYGDFPADSLPDFAAMTFGKDGNGGLYSGDGGGASTLDKENGIVNMSYTESVDLGNTHYMAKLKFNFIEPVPVTYRYVRVFYSAKNPSGTVGASLYIVNDGKSDTEIVELQKDIADTNGEYVLSDTAYLTKNMLERFAGTGAESRRQYNSICVNAAFEGGSYSVKGIYFFPTKEAADAFGVQDMYRNISINGNDISKYQIVIDSHMPEMAMTAVTALTDHIKELVGVDVPVVTDEMPSSEYEILIGTSSRALSQKPLEAYDLAKDDYRRYAAAVEGDTLIIASANYYPIKDAVDVLMSSFLYKNVENIPNRIALDGQCAFTGLSALLTPQTTKGTQYMPQNVENPTEFTESFDSDRGYFTEENNTSDWRYENGEFTTSADERSLAYVHVYESNVDYTAKLRYTKAGADGNFGLMLRYVADDAYLAAGYDFETEEWYIDYREGTDFYCVRAASLKAAIAPDTQYTLNFVSDGENAALSVNGEQILTASGIVHVTPGRAAVFAENADAAVDDVRLVLLSGEGDIMKNVTHTKLPEEKGGNAAVVYDMLDGTLLLQTHTSGKYAYKSDDSGKTWEKTEGVFELDGCSNVIRLNNGDFLQVYKRSVNGSVSLASRTSSDNGKTWTDGGIICSEYFEGTQAKANNMNDKLSQSVSTGRIFYCQTFTGAEVNGRTVFCEFFYSDDNGAVWQKSAVGSWEISGLEGQQLIGECKILECADGTLRMYNSYNTFGCIVYSESSDNGVTWGPIVKLEEFICPRSSMQFVRDPYGETDTTYYMIWPHSEPDNTPDSCFPRSRLLLAKTTDGKNWEYLGEIWRWESEYYHQHTNGTLNHMVNPSIQVTEDAIILCTGLSERLKPGMNGIHGYQEQHIWSLDRDSLPEGRPISSLK